MIQTFKTKLISKKKLTENVYLVEFRLIDPSFLEFKAGQYLILLCPQPDGLNIRRLFSIASHQSNHETFELVAELIPNGVASTYFVTMNEGDEVQFQGPAGMFTLRGTNNRIFLATGTGIAPMMSMLQDIIRGNARSDHSNILFWGVPHFKDLYFIHELRKFKDEHPNFSFYICVSRETSLDSLPEDDKKYYMLGRVTVGLEKILGKDTMNGSIEIPKDQDYYLCAGRTVVEFLRQYLYYKNVPKERVIFEKF